MMIEFPFFSTPMSCRRVKVYEYSFIIVFLFVFRKMNTWRTLARRLWRMMCMMIFLPKLSKLRKFLKVIKVHKFLTKVFKSLL